MESQYGIKIDQWPGLASNRSPHTAPQFADQQDNMQCLVPGILSARKGMRTVTWSSKDSASSNEIIGMYHNYTPSGETVLFQNSSGDVFVASGPS